jgi:arylsulfatase A-like enzyme
MTEHGHSLHSEVVRVPLILAAPGVPAGASVETAVRTIDILPTLLDLVAGSGSSPETAEGSSLLPLVRGRDPDRPVFSEAMLYGSTERSLQAGRFKLMWDEQGDRTSLFDVAADPGEENDLAAQETPRVERMTRDLREWNDRVGREVPAGAASDEDQALQALRALGYVD